MRGSLPLDDPAGVQIPPFDANELSPSCGPSTGGTKFIIHGTGFNFCGNTDLQASPVALTPSWAQPTDLDDAKVRFMHGNTILASVAATIFNSSKIECKTVPYTCPLLHATCKSWGTVSLWISVRGSPYVQCKQPFVYYQQPSIFHVSPLAVSLAAVASDQVDLSMRLTLAETPQHVHAPTQRERLALDVKTHSMVFRVLLHTSTTTKVVHESLRGNVVLPDDGATDGVAVSVHLPAHLAVGTYSLQMTFNLIDFTAAASITEPDETSWTSWRGHGLFTIFAPPILTGVSPPSCYYIEGQTLQIHGLHLAAPAVRRRQDAGGNHRAIVRFTKATPISSSQHDQRHYQVEAMLATNDMTTLVVQSPRFNDPGHYDVAVSVNGGAHFSSTTAAPLLVYLKPSCEFVSPAHGVSMGGTDLHLRLSFGYARSHDDRPNIALEDSTFDDPHGLIRVRFYVLHTSELLQTVPGFVSSCRKFIHCTTPRNAMVDQFRHSQTEAMALQVSLDGGIVFFPVAPKAPFTYYAPPKLRRYAPLQGPATGGTILHLHVGVPIPDTFRCHLRFRGAKLYHDVHDVPMTKSMDGLTLSCRTPSWTLEPGEGHAMALVELTLNGVDYFSDLTEFEPCTHSVFTGYGQHFCYFAPPRLSSISTKFLSCRGDDDVVIDGAGLRDFGGAIRVAFSNGKTTKYVDGTLDRDHRVVCRAPPFAPGLLHPSVEWTVGV
ncbi:hypothetical protein, variant 2 [Aphanomyces invadans]|uniref:IPT/TIG domain-containing protein n=1 Tax=Aphanomyces invadans TaxID=157072 RepID=A0A024TS54_9STRA|nr:hypothetical protein, variant 1 [Aphanomyces invadans]XP_008874625.1 hypothetical protein, variant 2 [Aphanomyces invadans]ETV96847.1 hypothetical protein, variant 1 [Aphanomyces invadans]ETV96848.1 hypothetical protein, variant 2 [Aphanomyces invadans]|eukprot:XP_008874623.1 hypothetical protein, variant 1 [Aphanomyces invadans]